jgi:hypothetical protein
MQRVETRVVAAASAGVGCCRAAADARAASRIISDVSGEHQVTGMATLMGEEERSGFVKADQRIRREAVPFVSPHQRVHRTWVR